MRRITQGGGQWAAAAGTINYEVVTRLGDHIPRIHIRAGRSQ